MNRKSNKTILRNEISQENCKDELEKAAKMIEKSEYFLPWLDKTQAWIDNNLERIKRIFAALVDDRISYEYFKAGLKDLGVPCSDVELHYICLVSDDNKTGKVEIERLGNVLKSVTTSVENSNHFNAQEIVLPIAGKKKDAKNCKQRDGSVQRKPFPSYVEIHFRFLPFRHFDSHPGHVTAVVESSATMLQLSNLVGSLSGIISRKFQFRLSVEEDFIPYHSCLQDVGIMGGGKFEPVRQTLFYDYEIVLDFCPILLCDHYFCETVL